MRPTEAVNKMLTGWMWVILLCIQLNVYFGLCTLVITCSHIIPESPVIQIGAPFVASCIFNESCISRYGADANNIYWQVKNTKVPKEQYTVVNRTFAQVTFNDSSVLESPLTCNILTHGQLKQTLYGIFITLGLPPEKPKNLTCIVYQKDRMTCTWNPGRDTYLPTNYTLKNRWFVEEKPDCIPKGVNNSCTIESPNFQFFVNTELWVEAENTLGKSESDRICLDPVNIVKPNAPVINSVNSTPELPNALKITWTNPFNEPEMSLKFGIRYWMAGSTNFTELPSEDTASHRDSFTLQGLKPFSAYIISVRCMNINGKGYWSDWSTEMTGTTPEAKPSRKLDLWRRLTSSLQGKRTLHLMWKEMKMSDANGIILVYEVQISQNRRSLSLSTNVTDTSLYYPLGQGAYVATVAAYNSAGKSPTATLNIQAESQAELPPVQNFTAFPKDSRLWVEWQAPGFPVNGYILEFCVESEVEPCTLEWQQEDSTAESAAISGNLEPFKRYRISIYPLYSGSPGAARTLNAYLQDDVPSKGPDVTAKKIDKTEAVLYWEPLPIDSQRGFIRYYTIFYTPNNGKDTLNVTVDPTYTEYTLSSLSKDTSYLTYMMAFTDQGGTAGRKFTFSTLKFAKGEIETIVVPVCLAFLVSSLLGVLFCFNKRGMIKKHVWPNVPDPSNSTIAQWSPQSPTPQSCAKPICPENAIIDVSVVELEPEAKSKLTEQDMDASVILKKENSSLEDHSSGIGGSSCTSTPRQSISDSEESESAQTTSGSVQYSTVVASSYRGQLPSAHIFARSESTQPLLDSEERPEDQHMDGIIEGCDNGTQGHPYFKQNCGPPEANTSGSHLKGPNTVSQTISEDNLVRLNQLQILAQGSSSLGFSPAEGEAVQELQAATAGLQQSIDGQTVVRLDLLGLQRAGEAGGPKSYLPQILKKSGYMPQ